jgi:eukaryotic-like serine/threonine-protein kinase
VSFVHPRSELPDNNDGHLVLKLGHVGGKDPRDVDTEFKRTDSSQNDSDQRYLKAMGHSDRVDRLEVTGTLPIPMSGNRYKLLAELGRGGMATAYLAAMQGPAGFSKLVVVKRLRPGYASEDDFLKMFLEEAKLAALIDHPNVVHTAEVAFDGKNYFIAMEYIEGQSLEMIVRKARRAADGSDGEGSRLPLKFHLHVLMETLNGLHFAHELKSFDGKALSIVHRDVSPHNVMVTYEGHVKLVDFGIAKAATSQGDTSTGVIKGKAAYMPSEQFGGKNIDRRADLFAVGVMLWQAITGRRLWQKLSDAEIFAKVSVGDIPKPSEFAEVDPELEAICMRALALRSQDRYGTAMDFYAALETYVRARRELLTSSRELGAWLSSEFVDDRRKIKARIEESLVKGGSEGDDASLPLLAATQVQEPSRQIERSSVSESQSHVAPAPSPSRTPFYLAAVAVLAAAGVVGFTLWPKAEVARDVGSTKILVTVAPASATVVVDGQVLAGNPPSASFNRDGKSHVVVVRANGFSEHRDDVTFGTALVELDVSLSPVASATPVALVPSEAPPSLPSAPTIAASPGRTTPHHAASAKASATTLVEPAATLAVVPTIVPVVTAVSALEPPQPNRKTPRPILSTLEPQPKNP